MGVLKNMKKLMSFLSLFSLVIIAMISLSQTGSAIKFRQTAPIKAISLSQASVKLAIGENYKLEASVIPKNSLTKWSTSNSEVATVKNGVVSAIGTGKCIITAATDYVSTDCTVTVCHNKSHQ